MADRYVRLNHKDGSFSDPHSLFHITGSEVKLLPEPFSPAVRLWLNAGGLLFCDPPKKTSGDESSLDVILDIGVPTKGDVSVKEDVTLVPIEEEPEVVKKKTGRPKGSTKKKK
jgi:hypothetical protein